MRVQHVTLTAMVLLMASPAVAAPSRADFATRLAASPHAQKTRTVTLDLTGLD